MSLYDEASLIITPNAYKEDKLYAVKPTDGSGDLTWTRASTKTRVNSEGLVEELPYNLFTYSEQFDNAAWSKSNTTISTNATTAPNGTLTADLLIPSTSYTNHFLFQQISFSSSTGQIPYTQSIFAKSGNYVLQITGSTGFEAGTQNFDLSSGTLGSSSGAGIAEIVDAGNGFYQCIYTLNSVAGLNGRIIIAIVPLSNSGRIENFAGDGTSGIYLWGAQLNTGTTAKPYFPTTDRLDIPSIDYTGGGCPSILVEPQRTNLITYSEDFNNASWIKSFQSITYNQPDPFGGNNASLCTFTNLSTSRIAQVSSIVAGNTYTLSAWIKGVNVTEFRFLLATNQVIFVTNQIVNGEWVRVSATVTATSTGNYQQSPARAYNTNGESFYIWGAQLEQGSSATSYIPTVASTVTRVADAASKTGISSLIGSKQGTVILDIAALANDGTTRMISLSNGSNTNRIIFYYGSNNINFIAYIVIGGVFTYVATASLADNTQFNKIAVTYNETNMRLWANGTLIQTNTTGILFPENTLNRFGFDSGVNNSTPFYGKVKGIDIYKTVLSDEKIIQRTT
tara:strand:+ start:14297 stop:15994 length:1698 start_codon:yes stop_codon:yes gene_type:complete